MWWKSFITVGAIALVATGSSQTARFKSDEILVKFKDSQQGMSPVVHTVMGTTVLRTIPQINFQRVKLPAGMKVSDAIAKFKKNPAIEFAEPNYLGQSRVVPNDPQFAQQPHYNVVHLPQAWDFTLGSGQVIAIIDDGLDVAHPDLAANVVPGHDFIDNDSDPTPSAGNDHGTHVSGIAAAVTNNGAGVSGAGWNSKLMGLRIDYSVAQSTEAIIWAADHGAKIINMSYGYYGPPTIAERNAVEYAWSKGVLLIGAAGNINTNSVDSYPDGHEKVISVGATQNNDTKAAFSDWGPRVDVAAPGVDILSTIPGNNYARFDGTSMSSPLTCGVATIVWSHAGPGYTNADIRQLLESTSVNVGTWLQFGRVDAKAACDGVGTPTPFDFAPTEINVFEGTLHSGNLASAMNSDNNYYRVNSAVIPKAGSAAAAWMQFTVDQDISTVKDLKVKLEVAAVAKTTLFVHFWDWNTSKWVSFKQFPLKATDQQIVMDLDKSLAKWMNGSGQVRMMLRAYAPNRVFGGKAPNFAFNIDKASIDTIFIVI